ncbi:MAG: nitrogenase [Deltaproteobacteria bacterium]|nr:nitrogenase [Deltaproteobacteria bacterium]
MKNSTALQTSAPAPAAATTNACKLCMPLGASLAFKGVEGAVPFLHGSQGCATYMRRYLISHFREPVDIASSALGETQAVFGGGPNLKKGLVNVINKYRPRLVGVATTCLTETIGDDVPAILKEFRAAAKVEGGDLPELVSASTPAYGGTHVEGFHAAVTAVVKTLTQPTPPHPGVNLLPGLVSPADLRHLAAILADFGLAGTILPDFSDTLDAPALEEYEILPSGGTPLTAIRAMGGAAATLEFGATLGPNSAGTWLAERWGVPLHSLGLPLGLRESDAFYAALEEVSGRETPPEHAGARGRLVDAMVDGHKYLSGKRAVVYGEEDLVVGLASWLAELGVQPVLCASGASSGRLAAGVARVTEGLSRINPQVASGADFAQIGEWARELAPDLLVGHSKGYRIARELGVPLVRVGFPIHDRLGGTRLHHLAYLGAQELLDRIVNALLAHTQDASPVGYGYL